MNDTGIPEITPDDIEDILLDSMENTAPAYNVVRLLEKYDGKRISRRMYNTVVKGMPDYDVGWERVVQMTYIVVKGKGRYGRVANGGIRMLLGYDTRPVFDHAFFQEANACHLHCADDRNDKRRKALEEDTILRRVVDALNSDLRAQLVLNAYMSYDTQLSVEESRIRALVGERARKVAEIAQQRRK